MTASDDLYERLRRYLRERTHQGDADAVPLLADLIAEGAPNTRRPPPPAYSGPRRRASDQSRKE